MTGEPIDVAELERNRLDAMHRLDVPALETLLHEQFAFTHMNGLREGKDEFLARLRSGDAHYHPARLSELRPAYFDHCSLVTGTNEVKVDILSSGQSFDMRNRFISVWVEQGGRWKIAAYQSTPIVD